MIIKSKNLLFNISKYIRHKPQQALYPYTCQKYQFSTDKIPWNKDIVIKKINKEILDTQTSILNKEKDQDAYFKKLNWQVAFDEKQNLFLYSKKQSPYDIKILTPVKYDPPNCADRQATEKQQQQNKFNYSHIVIFIKKNGEHKWLTAQMLVVQGSVELLGVFFTEQQPSLNWPKALYPGPQLSTLPETIIASINQMMIDVGLSTEVLMNMVIFSSSKIQQLDLRWLQNLYAVWN